MNLGGTHSIHYNSPLLLDAYDPTGEVRQTCKFKIPHRCCYISLNKSYGDKEEREGEYILRIQMGLEG